MSLRCKGYGNSYGYSFNICDKKKNYLKYDIPTEVCCCSNNWNKRQQNTKANLIVDALKKMANNYVVKLTI